MSSSSTSGAETQPILNDEGSDSPRPADAAAVVDVYCGGPLDQEGTHRVACVGAFLSVLCTITLPATLAYLAGRQDGQGDPLSAGVALPAAAAVALLLAVTCVWGCCCSWNPKLGCVSNVAGAFIDSVIGKLTLDNQHEPSHVETVTAAVNDQNLKGAAMGNPAKLMAKHSITCASLINNPSCF